MYFYSKAIVTRTPTIEGQDTKRFSKIAFESFVIMLLSIDKNVHYEIKTAVFCFLRESSYQRSDKKCALTISTIEFP